MKPSTPRSQRVALALMSFLFLLIGTLASFNDVLKPFLQQLFGLTYGQSSLIHFAFYLGYFFMSIPASILAARLGYRRTIIMGLSIMLLGGSLGILAGFEAVFVLYVLAVFGIAVGVAVLGVLVNPYVNQLGSEKTSASRLNLVNAFYSTGGIIGPLVGAFLLYQGTNGGQSSISASQSHAVYLGLIGVLIMGILVFLFVKIPEPSIAQSNISFKSFVGLIKEFRNLRWGIIAMFVYVGIEVGTGSLIAKYLSMERIWGIQEDQAGKWVSVYWGSFMVGRLIAAQLGERVSAARMLQVNIISSMLLVIFVIYGKGQWAGYALLGLGLTHSVMFSSIFSMGVAGLGDRVQQASAFIFMLVVGGAVITFFQNNLADISQIGIQGSFGLTFLCYLYILWYALVGYKPRKHS